MGPDCYTFFWQSKRICWERAQRAAGWGTPGGLLHHVALSLGDGIGFQVVFGQSLWLRVLPGGARIAQPRWMPEGRILRGAQTHGVSFWPFPNSSSWWLISSVFTTRTSCHKITHAHGDCGAWPGWAVSVSVLPQQLPPRDCILKILSGNWGKGLFLL